MLENSGMGSFVPESSWGCMVVANKIWKALGAPDSMGISSIGGHNHCQFPDKQVEDLNAFVDKFLVIDGMLLVYPSEIIIPQ